MKPLTKLAVAVPALGILCLLMGGHPASAITADLAKKCRKLALEAHPPAKVGSKKGNSALVRQFYRACVANGGSPPNESRKPDAAQGQPQPGTGGAPPATAH